MPEHSAQSHLIELRWIPCTEAMPIEDNIVFVWTEYGTIHRARHTWNGAKMVWAYHDRDAGISDRVTHWMAQWLPDELTTVEGGAA